MSRDPKLRWLKLERTDDRLLVAERPCVCKTSKRTPDDDVTTCDDLRAGIHITEERDVTRIVKALPGAQRLLNQEACCSGGLRTRVFWARYHAASA